MEINKKQLWFRRLLKFVLAVILVVIVVLVWPESEIEVRTSEVASGVVEEIVYSTQAGVVKANRQSSLRAVTIGQVKTIAVEKTQHVTKGQLLVELENETLRARLRLAQANLATGESALRSALLRKSSAKSSLDRSSQLYGKGVLSSQALERVQTEYDLASESVSTAEANQQQIKANVELALASLDETRIRAPFDGIIVDIHIEEGESLVVATPVLEIIDDASISIEAMVDEADAGRIAMGMPVRVNADAFPDRRFLGNLNWIAPMIVTDLVHNRHLEVEVGLDGSASILKVGMSADIEIIVQQRQNVLFVPTNAIIRRGNVEQVYLVKAGRAHLANIETGLANWERTQVVEGLQVGEQVVLSLGTKGLREGVKVRSAGGGSDQSTAY